MGDPVDDDEPEPRNTSDPARQAFWRAQWQTYSIGAGLLVAIVVVLLVVILTR